MSVIKLFEIEDGVVTELEGEAVAVEKSLQNLIEAHLEDFLGVRFLGSEYATSKAHGGRIDTLGIDEDGGPVIIEYKRHMSQNVINQGLFYLNWLLDHKAAFTLEVMNRFGGEAAESIDWSSPRLVCIAGDFTKYDEHAIEEMDRNIDLVRYRRYGKQLLLLERVNAVQASVPPIKPRKPGTKPKYKTQRQRYDGGSQELRDRFDTLSTLLEDLGDDVQVKWLTYYVAFRRLRNFATAMIRPGIGSIRVNLPLNPDTVALEKGFTRDVRNIGHHGIGDLEIAIRSDEDLEKAKPLLIRSFEAS